MDLRARPAAPAPSAPAAPAGAASPDPSLFSDMKRVRCVPLRASVGGRARPDHQHPSGGRASRPTNHPPRCTLSARLGWVTSGDDHPPPAPAACFPLHPCRASRRPVCVVGARASRCATGWPRSRGGNRGRTTTPKRVCRLAQCGWLNKAPRTGSVLTFERSGGERIDHATLRRRVNHPHLIWSAQNSHLCRGPQADSGWFTNSVPPLLRSASSTLNHVAQRQASTV